MAPYTGPRGSVEPKTGDRSVHAVCPLVSFHRLEVGKRRPGATGLAPPGLAWKDISPRAAGGTPVGCNIEVPSIRPHFPVPTWARAEWSFQVWKDELSSSVSIDPGAPQ